METPTIPRYMAREGSEDPIHAKVPFQHSHDKFVSKMLPRRQILIIRWPIACRQFLAGKRDAAQSLGCSFDRMMAGTSFYCGLPSGRKDLVRHRLVLRKHWQSSKRRWVGLGRKLGRKYWR